MILVRNMRLRDRLSAACLPVLLFATFVPGCAPGPGKGVPVTGAVAVDSDTAVGPVMLHEVPVPPGKWREHRLARCRPDTAVPYRVEKYLGTCSELFRDRSGSDGMIELEMALEAGVRHPLILLTLGQLYLMAGQGEPGLMPNEGPAADVGDWPRNQQRLLGRARLLLQEAGRGRPDDAAVDYLLADVTRAGGDFEGAAELVARGMTKCTGGRSFRIMQQYQDLRHYPAKYLGGVQPEFPREALAEGLSGDVVLDLLLDPAADIRQTVVVSSPGASLTRAAEAALKEGDFTPSKVGKYPVWSWLRVTISFNLAS